MAGKKNRPHASANSSTRRPRVAGLEFLVVKNVSIGLTYRVGEDAPNFKQAQALGGTIGIRF